MATNDFLAFASDGGANVQSQATYAAYPLRGSGNVPGIAVSALNNKAVRQANAVTSQVAQHLANVTQVNVTDDATPTKMLAQIQASLGFLAPVTTRHTSGTSHNLTYYFYIASGSATAAATYTNNAVTYTVVTTVASGTLLRCTGAAVPLTSGTLTKASGTGDATITFYAYRSALYVKGVATAAGGGGKSGGGDTGSGGGGGGGGGGTAIVQINAPTAAIAFTIGAGGTGGASPTAGGNSTIGTTLAVAIGGSAGGASSTVNGGVGGTAGGTTAGDEVFTGADGGPGQFGTSGVSNGGGGYGGGSFYGGGAQGGAGGAATGNGSAGGNYGCGGGGGSGAGTGGAGGGSLITFYEYFQ